MTHTRRARPVIRPPVLRHEETEQQRTMPAKNAIQGIKRTILEHRPVLMSVAVLGWSLKYLVDLGLTHTTGPELYGVLTAALAAGAAGSNLVILRSSRPQLLLAAVLLGLWALIALAGVGGTIAHIVGPVGGHGPMDLRPRPIAAPLIFTLLGLVGGAALVLGQRARVRLTTTSGKG
jgi:hypothetical protein